MAQVQVRVLASTLYASSPLCSERFISGYSGFPLSFALRGLSLGTPVFPSPLLREVYLRVLQFSPLLCSERFISGYSSFPLSFAPRGLSSGTPVFPSPLLREVYLRVLRFSPLLCSERFISGYSGFPLSFAPRGLSPGSPVFPSPQLQKPTFSNFNSTRNHYCEEPPSGSATSKSLFILVSIIIY